MNTNQDSYVLIIPAAGYGSRFGSKIPKQFTKINKIEIIIFNILNLKKISNPIEIIIAIDFTKKKFFEKLLLKYQLNEVKLIEGGATRQKSIFEALKHVENINHLIAIHDSVRPFITKDLITKLLSIAKINDGAIPALQSSSTLKLVEGECIAETLDRSVIFQAHTPQVFKYKNLLEANNRAIKDDFQTTDDSAIMEKYGYKIKWVESYPENIKITNPIDKKLAKMIMKDFI